MYATILLLASLLSIGMIICTANSQDKARPLLLSLMDVFIQLQIYKDALSLRDLYKKAYQVYAKAHEADVALQSSAPSPQKSQIDEVETIENSSSIDVDAIKIEAEAGNSESISTSAETLKNELSTADNDDAEHSKKPDAGTDNTLAKMDEGLTTIEEKEGKGDESTRRGSESHVDSVFAAEIARIVELIRELGAPSTQQVWLECVPT